MILVTGGTGFIGQSLIRRLAEGGHAIRTLIRPSEESPKLPPGIPIQAAISSLADERGLRAAMVGVNVVFHLAGVNWTDRPLDWQLTEVEGTRNVLEAAQDVGVERLLYLSQLGADRAAAYPMFKAKGIAEERIRKSSLPFTILRSGLVFGPSDNFTVPLAQLLALAPGFFPMAGDGNALLQPIWVEDLVSCLVGSLDEEESINALFEIGGPEHLTIREVIEEVQIATGLTRTLVSVRPSYMRMLLALSRFLLPRIPASPVWIDYLSASRITELTTLPRIFSLSPSRFTQRLDHLKGEKWRSPMLPTLGRGPS